MRVIVVGCGRVGSGLAMRLQREGHSVTIIDKQKAAFRRVPEEWGGNSAVGFGFDHDLLESVGARETDALAAVTSGDNTNILTARIARETFEIPNVVARIYDPRRAVIYERLGIPTVATVSWTVDQIARKLLPAEAITQWTDPTGEMHLVEHALPEWCAGRSYSELFEHGEFSPTMVTRGSAVRLVYPDLIGQEGDVVVFLAKTDSLAMLDERLKGAPR